MDAVKWFPLQRVAELEQRVAQIVTTGSLLDRRDALAVALGLHGLRVGEVIRLRNADLFEPTRMLSVATIKNGRPRKVLVDHSVIEAIRNWQAECPFASSAPAELMLPNRVGRPCRREQFERMARRITTELAASLPFHAMRHTFAMRLYSATKDLFLVQRMLGHKSVKSTEVYARSLEDVPDECMVKLGRSSIAEASPAAALNWAI